MRPQSQTGHGRERVPGAAVTQPLVRQMSFGSQHNGIDFAKMGTRVVAPTIDILNNGRKKQTIE